MKPANRFVKTGGSEIRAAVMYYLSREHCGSGWSL
jgi:hypothetical protein